MSDKFITAESVDMAQLVEEFRTGDSAAARELFNCFASRLTSLVRVKLSARLGRRLDADDIVQSAMGSFFQHARGGEFAFQQSDDVWRLLASITLNKLRQKIEYHTAAKRGIQNESPDLAGSIALADIAFVSREPSPEAQLAVVEEVEILVSGLDDWQRQVVHLRLEGYRLEEIAQMLSRSERTIRRVMEKVRVRLEERLLESSVLV